jgi:hypothetical protein
VYKVGKTTNFTDRLVDDCDEYKKDNSRNNDDNEQKTA